MTFAETEKIELKQKLTDTIIKEIVAFLNTDGGTVYIGVNDDGSVCGVNNLDESLKKIADILEMQILPDPRDYVELGTKYINQKHVVEIKVQKGESLYYIKKYGRSAQGCYIRIGSTSRSMTVNDELAKLFIRLDLMEQTGFGIPFVTGRYGKSIFEFLDFFLRVTIPFAYEIESDGVNNGVNDGVNDGVTVILSDKERSVLSLIKSNPNITTNILINNTGFSRPTVERAINKLKQLYFIRRVGADKNGHWEVIKN